MEAELVRLHAGRTPAGLGVSSREQGRLQRESTPTAVERTPAGPGDGEGSGKDKIFEKVINPYLTEVLKHPQYIKMSEGMLHIRDVEGPKKTESVETKLEAMEQQVFKCQWMVERGINANHMMITEFTSNHKMDAIDIGKHLSRLYDRVDQLQG
ncbi:40S ribosomal protein S5-1 [Hordeum vulgare]|nr:40S ribosomal protein S5-1 [Hordeum vulgare]